jgi:8-oxo-dGTP pyrophosphatase MutT (NUDIX family)
MDRFEHALRWIHEILSREKIPFVVSGGLAARLHGATRPLYDIDLDIPQSRLKDLLPHVQRYVVFGPARFQDEIFDLELLTLNVGSQLIDIAGAESVRLFDKNAGVWRADPTDLTAFELRSMCGLELPATPRDLLIRYKRWIARPTDIQDIEEISQAITLPHYRSTSVRAVIRRGDAVFVEHFAPKKILFLPGGTVEDGEELTDTLRRELHEELTGSPLTIGRYLGKIGHSWSTREGVDSCLNHFFEVAATHPDALRSNEEGRAFTWMRLGSPEATKLQPPSLHQLLAEAARAAEWDLIDTIV